MGYIHWGLLALLLSAGVGYFFLGSHQPPEVPDIKLEYWGSGLAKPDDPAIRPFKIHFPQNDITELKTKLKLTKKLVPPLDGIGFEYGTNSNFMQEFIDYWINKYNWTEREKFLNKFPHFKTQIGGLDIHFLHVKPDPKKLNKDVRVVPLMLVHGWPGCIREFYELIPLLTEPRDGLVFEVVAPSLPGFAFSEAAKRTGMGPPQMAVVLAEIMTRLGHQQFYLQGGDWGSVIGQALSTLRPNRVLGFHCNFCLATNPAARNRVLLSWLFPSFFVEEDRIELYKKQFFDSFVKESGYYHIQATKPDTIGIALTDSPAGLAAYLLEKFSTGTNKDFRSLKNGGLDKYSKDDLLDFLMIYWLTNSITTSIRIYSENYLKETYSWEVASIPVNVPTHCARFPNEMLYYPKVVLKEQYTNLVSITDLPRGGHFAAFEEPKLLADDVWNFVKKNIHL